MYCMSHVDSNDRRCVMYVVSRREVLPDGILYASKDSHYSVFKAARMYRMEVVKVDTLLSGEIDCNDLARKLSERAHKPAILNVNIGNAPFLASALCSLN